MNRSVIVFGPPGCGKTSESKRLAKHFGLDHIADDADAILREAVLFKPANILYLTQNRPGWVLPDDRRTLPFADAMALLKSEVPSNGQFYCYSTDEELFHGDHATREDAIAAGFERYPDAPAIYIGTQVRYPAHRFVDGESILTQVSECAGDEAGECAEDWLWGSEIRKPEKLAELEQLVGDWIQVNEPPTFYMVEDVETVTRPVVGAA